MAIVKGEVIEESNVQTFLATFFWQNFLYRELVSLLVKLDGIEELDSSFLKELLLL